MEMTEPEVAGPDDSNTQKRLEKEVVQNNGPDSWSSVVKAERHAKSPAW